MLLHELVSLTKNIASLKENMQHLALYKGFTHPDVVSKSQELDLLIVRYQKLILELNQRKVS